MIYPNIIYHEDSGTEIFIDTLQQIGNTGNAEIVSFQDSLTGSIRTFNRSLDPNGVTLFGKVSTDNVDTLRRQLQYIRGKQIYLMLGAQNMATLAKIRSFNLPVSVGTYSPLTLDVVCDGDSEGQFWEAEDCTQFGGVITSDCDACMGKCMALGAVDTIVYATVTQDDIVLPEGDYVMFARVKDTNQVTDDVGISVRNYTDDDTTVVLLPTVTSDYKVHVQTFSIGSADAGDDIQFRVYKRSATTNTIYVDFIGFVRK